MDFAWAWTLGIVFQYFTIVPMRNVGKVAGIWAAIKAGTLSIVAFQPDCSAVWPSIRS